jgi:hypothetical protein
MKKVLEKIKNWFQKLVENVKNWFQKLVNKIKRINKVKAVKKARNLSLILAGVFIMIACVIYIFASDLFATNTAAWLMGGAVLGFGAGIASMLSELKKENLALTFTLKEISLLLMIGFIIFLIFFQKSEVITQLDETDRFTSLLIAKILNKQNYQGIECLKAINVSMVFVYILSAFGIVTQIFNNVSNAALGIEE